MQFHPLINPAVSPNPPEVLPDASIRILPRLHEPPMDLINFQLQGRSTRPKGMVIPIVHAAIDRIPWGPCPLYLIQADNPPVPRFADPAYRQVLQSTGRVGSYRVAICQNGVCAELQTLEEAGIPAHVLNECHFVHGKPSLMTDSIGTFTIL